MFEFSLHFISTVSGRSKCIYISKWLAIIDAYAHSEYVQQFSAQLRKSSPSIAAHIGHYER